MNQSLFLHIVEKLEGFLGKLPATIQKPILHELTPLKELFLQQRSPRFVFVGSSKLPLQEILPALFGLAAEENRDALMEIFRWLDLKMNGQGTITVLDARGADESAVGNIRDELKSQAADIFFLSTTAMPAGRRAKGKSKTSRPFCNGTKKLPLALKSSALRSSIPHEIALRMARRGAPQRKNSRQNCAPRSKKKRTFAITWLRSCRCGLVAKNRQKSKSETERLVALITQHLPNQARVEMLRISRDRAAQTEVAQVLVKSTTAICAAIGAQPIPLADLPILTTLQLVMVSGIMYLSGRERSLRAATEFMGALGANVGAGMLLREGTRALLKFFPGWGNVVCGMVAGAGTYAIGRAAIVYFIEGVSLKDARRTYLTSRKKPSRSKQAPSVLGR